MEGINLDMISGYALIQWHFGEEHGYSCLGNPMDKGVLQAAVCGVTESWTWLKWLRTHTPVAFAILEEEEEAWVIITKTQNY